MFNVLKLVLMDLGYEVSAESPEDGVLQASQPLGKESNKKEYSLISQFQKYPVVRAFVEEVVPGEIALAVYFYDADLKLMEHSLSLKTGVINKAIYAEVFSKLKKSLAAKEHVLPDDMDSLFVQKTHKENGLSVSYFFHPNRFFSNDHEFCKLTKTTVPLEFSEGLDVFRDRMKAQRAFDLYVLTLQQHIRNVWRPPINDLSNRAVVLFLLDRLGKIQCAKFIQPSSSSKYNELAAKAIKDMPLMPLPKEYKEESVRVEFVFDMNVHR